MNKSPSAPQRSSVLGRGSYAEVLRIGEIALTFDDGPHPTRSKRVLDILESAGVRATYFLWMPFLITCLVAVAQAAPAPVARSEVMKALTRMGYEATDATRKAVVSGLDALADGARHVVAVRALGALDGRGVWCGRSCGRRSGWSAWRLLKVLRRLLHVALRHAAGLARARA